MRVFSQSLAVADPAGVRPERLSSAGRAADHLPFRAVNQRGGPGYDSGLQRHHLLPRQLLSLRSLSALFSVLPAALLGYDDFRRNGLLLPADPGRAARLALPLHRGPHRHYNGMVIERVGAIERDWAQRRRHDAEAARTTALFRIRLLQRALHRSLLTPASGRNLLGPRCAPLDASLFRDLDAMAELLWNEAAARDRQP